MAAFSCPDCGAQASTDQGVCPGCGGSVKLLARKVISKRTGVRPPREATGTAKPDSRRIWLVGSLVAALAFIWFVAPIFVNKSDPLQGVDGIGYVNTAGMPTAPPAASRKAGAIESQFSAWDGSHVALTRKIKERLHDDDSYSHINTAREIKDGKVYIMTSFRASNALGATVMNMVVAEASATGNGSDVAILSWD